MFVAIFWISLSYSINANANQPLCNPESMQKSLCSILEKYKDQPHAKTSDGGRIRNPFAESSAENNETKQTRTIYSGSAPSVEQAAAAMDQYIENQLEFESILDATNFSKLPKRSQKAILQSFAIQIMISQGDASSGGLSSGGIGGYGYPMVPENLETGEGKLRAAKPEDLEQIAKLIGPEAIEKLKDLQKKSIENLTKNMASLQSTQAQTEPIQSFSDADLVVERTKRMKRLTEYAKNQMIEMVRAGRSDAQLTKAQMNAIKKIETVEYQDESHLVAKGTSFCAGDVENAFYQANTHTFSFCPKYLQLSDAQVISTIAHEIGHSIDPCRAPNPLLRVNQKAIEDWLAKNSPPEDDSSEEKKLKYGTLANFAYMKNNFANDIENLDGLKKSLGGELLPFVEVVAEKTTQSQYAFEPVRKCLVEKKNIDVVTTADVESSLKYLKAAAKRMGQKLTKVDEANFRKYLNSRKACGDGLLAKSPEHNEAMCDVFSGYVLARYWDENPPISDLDLVGGFSFFSSFSCTGNDQIASTLSQNPLLGLQLTHPISKHRLNLILQMPGMDKHLGCRLEKPSECYSSWGHVNQKTRIGPARPNQSKGGQK